MKLQKELSCLTIDCRKSGPSKYRTEADNNLKQTCCFTHKKRDRLFNKFIATNLNPDSCKLTFTIQTATENAIKERHLPHDSFLKKQDDELNNKKDHNGNGDTTKKIQKMNEIIKNSVIEMEQKPE